MIQGFFGDKDRVSLQSDYYRRGFTHQSKDISIAYSFDGDIDYIYDTFFKEDIFGSFKEDEIVFYYLFETPKLKNDNILKKIIKSKKQMYVFLFLDSAGLKNSKFYKSIGSKNIKELPSIHDGFGQYKEKEINSIIGSIKDLGYGNVFDNDFFRYLIITTKYGGILNDLDSFIRVAETQNISFEDPTMLSLPVNDYYLMSITSAIQDLDWSRLYSYLYHPDIQYMSVIHALQTMFYDMSRLCHFFADDDYYIDIDKLDMNDIGINKYSASMRVKYIKHIGHEKIEYIYRYLNFCMGETVITTINFPEILKFQDLGGVLRGKESLLYNI